MIGDSSVYIHRAMVTGTGPFPLDMMRYDCCWPSSSADVYIMEDTDKRTLFVKMASSTKKATWTPERWASFGWKLELTNDPPVKV